jgi:hypothetical protein
MPFGRAKRADIDETLRMRATPPRTDAAVEPPDEQATMRLGNDDDTLRLERN